MATVESTAAFKSRASAINVSEFVLGKLDENHLCTFGQFAFCCPYTPGSSDESPFSATVTEILGRAPSISELASLRRLYFESHALALQDMKTKINRSETDEPKALPAPERESRLRNQKSRLAGVIITAATQPANSLVDRCQQQLEDGMIKYIQLNKCASREQELMGSEKERVLIFDTAGHIKMNKVDSETSISISSDLQVKDAMSRRALAYDQTGMISYNILATWILKLFEAMLKESPFGYRRVSLDQVMMADREIWKLISEATTANVNVMPSGIKPVDEAFNKFMFAPEVVFHLLPLPASSSSSSAARSAESVVPWKINDNKFKKKKGDGKGKKGESKGKHSVPEGCVSMWDNKPICFSFNRSGCTYAKPGKRCRNGYHVCWKSNCFKAKSFKECGHAS